MIKKTKFLIKEGHLRVKYLLMKDCIFCKIVKGEITSKPLLENKHVLAIFDINPVADLHILIFPKVHIDSVMTIGDSDGGVIIEMYKAAQKLILERKLDAYRLAFNGGKYQHIPHLHMHLISGKKVEWKNL